MELTENRATSRAPFTHLIKAIASGSALLLLAAVFAFRVYQVKKRTSEELAAKNTIIDTQLKEKELLVREIHHCEEQPANSEQPPEHPGPRHHR